MFQQNRRCIWINAIDREVKEWRLLNPYLSNWNSQLQHLSLLSWVTIVKTGVRIFYKISIYTGSYWSLLSIGSTAVRLLFQAGVYDQPIWHCFPHILLSIRTNGPHNCTHCNVICRHRSGSILTKVIACCLAAPSHYPNQCWLEVTDLHPSVFSHKITFKI